MRRREKRQPIAQARKAKTMTLSRASSSSSSSSAVVSRTGPLSQAIQFQFQFQCRFRLGPGQQSRACEDQVHIARPMRCRWRISGGDKQKQQYWSWRFYLSWDNGCQGTRKRQRRKTWCAGDDNVSGRGDRCRRPYLARTAAAVVAACAGAGGGAGGPGGALWWGMQHERRLRQRRPVSPAAGLPYLTS